MYTTNYVFAERRETPPANVSFKLPKPFIEKYNAKRRLFTYLYRSWLAANELGTLRNVSLTHSLIPLFFVFSPPPFT